MRYTLALPCLAFALLTGCHAFPDTTDLDLPNTLSEDEREDGWRLLFDGETTRGWRGYRMDEMPTGWVVEDGALVHLAPEGEEDDGGGDIVTVRQFGNFDLTLEWWISPAGNSGVMFRVSEEFEQPFMSGPEVQILDNTGHPDGQSPLTSTGSAYALYAPAADTTQPIGEWNHMRVRVIGPHVEHWLNGVKIVEYELLSPEWTDRVEDSKFDQWPSYGRVRVGHIALQDQGDTVWFRNIKIRPLPPVE